VSISLIVIGILVNFELILSDKLDQAAGTEGWSSLFDENESVDVEVSERSERALRKTRILAMNPAKWLQTATSATKLTHSSL